MKVGADENRTPASAISAAEVAAVVVVRILKDSENDREDLK